MMLNRSGKKTLKLFTRTLLTVSLALGTLHAAQSAEKKSTKRKIAQEAVTTPADILSADACQRKDFDLIEALQPVVKKHSAFDYGKLLTDEQKNDKDHPDLNWIRAVNPWELPEDFPARPGFIRCAGSLRTAVDMRSPEAIEEWQLCWKSLYGDATAPAEFQSILRCLSPKTTN